MILDTIGCLVNLIIAIAPGWRLWFYKTSVNCTVELSRQCEDIVEAFFATIYWLSNNWLVNFFNICKFILNFILTILLFKYFCSLIHYFHFCSLIFIPSSIHFPRSLTYGFGLTLSSAYWRSTSSRPSAFNAIFTPMPSNISKSTSIIQPLSTHCWFLYQYCYSLFIHSFFIHTLNGLLPTGLRTRVSVPPYYAPIHSSLCRPTMHFAPMILLNHFISSFTFLQNHTISQYYFILFIWMWRHVKYFFVI